VLHAGVAQVATDSVPIWYHIGVATNLRLTPALDAALKERAASSGRTQQDIIREAVRSYLEDEILRGLPPRERPPLPLPREPFRRATSRLPLPPGVKDSLELLGRGDGY
jgi:hypothetical protein